MVLKLFLSSRVIEVLEEKATEQAAAPVLCTFLDHVHPVLLQQRRLRHRGQTLIVVRYFAAPHSIEASKNWVIATFRLTLKNMAGNSLPCTSNPGALLMFAWPRVICIIQVNSCLSIMARGVNLDVIA